MNDVERYLRIWWRIVLPPWLATFPLYFAVLGLSPERFVIVEVYHHLTLLLPLLAHIVAQRTVRARARRGKHVAKGIVAGPLPVWALPMFLAYGVLTLLFAALIQKLYYAGFLGIVLAGVCRIAFNVWWFQLCGRSADRVGILRRLTSGEREPVFVIKTLDGMKDIEIESIDAGMIDFHWKNGGTVESWHVVTRNDQLARAIREMRSSHG